MPMVRDYVSAGKVYLIYRYFPLPGHAYAREAASYACAAERIGKYEQVSNALFGNQAAWSADGKVDETACRVLTAAEAKKVRALIKDPGVAAEIQQDVELGQQSKSEPDPDDDDHSPSETVPAIGLSELRLVASFPG